MREPCTASASANGCFFDMALCQSGIENKHFKKRPSPLLALFSFFNRFLSLCFILRLYRSSHRSSHRVQNLGPFLCLPLQSVLVILLPPQVYFLIWSARFVLRRFTGSIPNGSLSLFTQILISSFGYTSQEALALSAPAGVVSVAFVLLTGWASDRFNSRTLVTMILLVRSSTFSHPFQLSRG
jgi:hypothetical protein